jgi:hypothetical protein
MKHPRRRQRGRRPEAHRQLPDVKLGAAFEWVVPPTNIESLTSSAERVDSTEGLAAKELQIRHRPY